MGIRRAGRLVIGVLTLASVAISTAPVDAATRDCKPGPGADLTDCKLERVNFSGMNLRVTNFTRADLKGANFTGANLTGAVFSGAILTNAKLANATLTSVISGKTVGPIASLPANWH